MSIQLNYTRVLINMSMKTQMLLLDVYIQIVFTPFPYHLIWCQSFFTNRVLEIYRYSATFFKLNFRLFFLRGGIPLCFPVFGPWDNGRPQHGFARNSNDWIVKEKTVDENGDANVILLSYSLDLFLVFTFFFIYVHSI